MCVRFSLFRGVRSYTTMHCHCCWALVCRCLIWMERELISVGNGASGTTLSQAQHSDFSFLLSQVVTLVALKFVSSPLFPLPKNLHSDLPLSKGTTSDQRTEDK